MVDGEGCYRYSCTAERDHVCQVCSWWICINVHHVVTDHRRCTVRWTDAVLGRGPAWLVEAARASR